MEEDEKEEANPGVRQAGVAGTSLADARLELDPEV